jgi:hypothetical protein
VFRRAGPPSPEELSDSLSRARETLASEPPDLRPPGPDGQPGGLVLLESGLPTIIVPDLHARMELLLSVLAWSAPGAGADRPGDETVLQLLAAGRIQVVCLGDGVHAEARAAWRWDAAMREFRRGYRRRTYMDQEMRESLGVMQMVMDLKSSCPGHFHFLKGNHENIANQQGEGNFPFVKLAQEGLMVLTYMRKVYGERILAAYAAFEKQLPLLAVGRNFLASHAEPASFFPREAVVAYRERPDVVYGLTWTGNGEAEGGSVAAMLAHYLGQEAAEGDYYFGGHRPVRGSYRLRASGRYVQIHDPDRFVAACLPEEGGIDLERDVRELENQPLRAFGYGSEEQS